MSSNSVFRCQDLTLSMWGSVTQSPEVSCLWASASMSSPSLPLTRHNSALRDFSVNSNYFLILGVSGIITDSDRIVVVSISTKPSPNLQCKIHSVSVSTHESLSNLSCGLCFGSRASTIIIRGGEAPNKWHSTGASPILTIVGMKECTQQRFERVHTEDT